MKIRTWFVAAVAALAAACGGAPKLNYYTLTAPPAPAPATQSSALSVFVGPVTVPEGVDRPQMVLRSGPNEVAIDDFHRWAEPLKSAIPRVLADSLMRELGTQRVMTTRQSSSLAFDYRVAVDVQRFDSSFDEGAAIDALWTIRSAKGGEPRTGRTVARESASSRDAQAVAAAHSRALDNLARDIAAAIRTLESR
jgi:uncharacterized protein